eukprot:6065746-Amphidinium_carterae.1
MVDTCVSHPNASNNNDNHNMTQRRCFEHDHTRPGDSGYRIKPGTWVLRKGSSEWSHHVNGKAPSLKWNTKDIADPEEGQNGGHL